jgi:hypothetical protein
VASRVRFRWDHFVRRMSWWTFFVTFSAFLPFVVLAYSQYIHGEWPSLSNVLHPGDLVLICTAIAAGAAGDLLGNVGREIRWFGVIGAVFGAMVVFYAGCFLFARFQQSQEDVVRAQTAVTVAQEVVKRDQGVKGQSEQLLQEDQRLLGEKQQDLERAQQHSNNENVIAWWAFAISAVVAASALAVEVYTEPEI